MDDGKQSEKGSSSGNNSTSPKVVVVSGGSVGAKQTIVLAARKKVNGSSSTTSSSTSPIQSPGRRTEKRTPSVVVVGGGPVGATQAIFLAKRGFEVDLYESKKDIRRVVPERGRSINLTLSHRGMEAMKAIDCYKEVMALCIPMYTRYVHLPNGRISVQPYGPNNKAILAIERHKLNELLLTKAEEMPNVTLHFEHKLTRSDLNSKTHTFSKDTLVTERNKLVDVNYAFTFGCDGVHSAVRRQMMRYGRMDFTQTNIEHGYKELSMVPDKSGGYAMPCNHFHIWPRQEFMMIAFPNLDKSFTLILYMPVGFFDTMKSGEDVVSFFKKYFPDVLDKLDVTNLVREFLENPLSFVSSVKCYPYYLDSQVMLMGDAAHAVVPFYGQGLNTGMEDCLIFDEYMNEMNGDFHHCAQRFSERRWRDGYGMADLSMYNYMELRSHVTSKLFLIRKYLDNILHFLLPSVFVPLYTMVTFTRIPIHEVIARNERQRKMINRAIMVSLVTGLLTGGYIIFKYARVKVDLSVSFQCFGHHFLSFRF